MVEKEGILLIQVALDFTGLFLLIIIEICGTQFHYKGVMLQLNKDF